MVITLKLMSKITIEKAYFLNVCKKNGAWHWSHVLDFYIVFIKIDSEPIETCLNKPR